MREQADEIQEVRYFDICDYVNRCSAFCRIQCLPPPGHCLPQSYSEVRRNERSELNKTVSDMDSYDIIFVRFPVWWHATPAQATPF